MTHTADILQAIDDKIRELELEQERLRALVKQLTVVTGKLDALKKSREVLAGNDTEAPPPETTPVLGNGLVSIPARVVVSRVVPGSIGATILEILQQAGRPMRVDEILDAIHQKGKTEVAQPTLASTLSTYVSGGKLRRTAPSTYDLAAT